MLTAKYNSHSSTFKAILGITQVITKGLSSHLVQSKYTYLHNSMSDFFTQPKRPGVCIILNILIALCDVHHDHLQEKGFYLLYPYRSQGCVEGQNICMHGVICFIQINLIMQHDYFQKRKRITM